MSVETYDNSKFYSGETFNGVKLDHAITTDGGNATMWQADGTRVDNVPGTAFEYVGEKTKEDDPAKIIYAKNGNIEIRAPNGQITLIARNIRIVAADGSGEITLDAAKILSLKAPYIKENSTNMTITASANYEVMAGTKSGAGQIKNCEMSGTDEVQGSFLGKAASSLKNLKKFFKDCFGVG